MPIFATQTLLGLKLKKKPDKRVYYTVVKKEVDAGKVLFLLTQHKKVIKINCTKLKIILKFLKNVHSFSATMQP